MGNQKDRWPQTLSNEYVRLTQGNDHRVVPTETINFIPYDQVPHGQEVTYVSFVCDYWQLKVEEWQVCCVVGGDHLAPAAASLLKTKLMVNSSLKIRS